MLGAALQCEKGGAPCFFALVLMKNTGALLLEYYVPSPKPSTNFREEMLMVAPLLALGPHGLRSGHIVFGSCSSRLLGPVLPSEISPKVKAPLERSSCLHITLVHSLSRKPGQDVAPQSTCLTCR